MSLDVNNIDLELTRRVLYLVAADVIVLTSYNYETKTHDHDKIYPIMYAFGRLGDGTEETTLSLDQINELYVVTHLYGYWGTVFWCIIRLGDTTTRHIDDDHDDIEKYRLAKIGVPKVLGIK